MKETMRGRNFRFSDSDMEKLDQLVVHFEKHAEHYMFWREVTRTDVLRYRIRGELGRIETAAAAAAAAELEAPKKTAKKKSAQRKAVPA